MFAVVPRRRVNEWSLDWLGRYRNLSKEYEYLSTSQENGIYLAKIMLVLYQTTKALP